MWHHFLGPSDWLFFFTIWRPKISQAMPPHTRPRPSRPEVSMLHVTQLDRIVDVVEEASRGRVVTLLEKTLVWLNSCVICFFGGFLPFFWGGSWSKVGVMLLWYLLGWFIICKADRCLILWTLGRWDRQNFAWWLFQRSGEMIPNLICAYFSTVWVEKPQTSN